MRSLTGGLVLALVLVSLLPVSVSGGAIISPVRFVSSQSTTCTGASCTSVSWSHLSVTGETLFILGVSITEGASETDTISSITYDDGAGPVDSFIQIASRRAGGNPSSTQELVEMWALSNPPAGSLGTIDMTTSCDLGCGASYQVRAGTVLLIDVSFDYAKASNLVQEFNLGTNTIVTSSSLGVGGGTISASPTSHQVGDLIVDVVGFQNYGIGNPTAGDSQTIRWQERQSQGHAGSSTAPESSTVSWTVDTNSHTALIAASIKGQSATPDDGGIDGGGGAGAGFGGGPTQLDYRCDKLSPVSWISASTEPASKNVTIYDNRRVAALVLQYLVNWGDGWASSATSMPISHTYEKEGLYTITARVAYRTGEIEVFATFVDVRGNNCALHAFVQDIFPILTMLGGLAFIAAFILFLTRKSNKLLKFKKEVRVLLQRYLLAIAAVSFSIIVVVAIYAAASGIPV